MDYSDQLQKIACHLVDLTNLFHGMFRGQAEPGKTVATTVQRYCILKHLQGTGSWDLSSLSRVLEFKKNTLSELVDRMVNDGLIDRTQDNRDRRKLQLKIQPAGIRGLEKFEREFQTRIDGFLVRLDPLARGKFVESLVNLIEVSLHMARCSDSKSKKS